MELRVSQGLKSLSALLLSYMASTLEVVQRKNVLQFLVSVHNRPCAVVLPDLNLVNDELVDIIRLLVRQ